MGTHEHIHLAVGKGLDDALVGVFTAGGFQVQALYAGVWKELLHLFLDFFGAKPEHFQVVIAAVPTRTGRGLVVPAVVAAQLVCVLVVGETYVAPLALGHLPTNLALPKRGVPAPILEQDDLFAFAQHLLHVVQ